MAITYHSGRRIQGTSSDAIIKATVDTTSSSGNTIITFIENTTFTPTSSFNIEYLVVAGGGGGGHQGGGGGGAGGFRTDTGHGVTAQNYDITVGAGGISGVSGTTGGNGGNSSIVPTSGTSIISSGGGGGGTPGQNSASGQSGGSGGGTGKDNMGSGGTGNSGNHTPVEGYNGGVTTCNASCGGSGGGGASELGNNGGSSETAGAGGDGRANSIVGSTAGVISSGTYYLGGGGGGGTNGGNYASGGLGGGGNADANKGENGVTNSGGGGGGGHYGSYDGGVGGSGIVIIKFSTSGNTYDITTGGRPTDVQVGSRLEETDTRKMYHYEAGDPTYETDFSSSTGWTTSSSSLIDISTANNELQVKENGGSLAQMYYDLGTSVSTTKWLIRCRILVNGSANTDEVLFGMQLNDTVNASSNTNSDALGFYVYTSRDNTWSRIYQVCKDNTTSVQGVSASPAYYGNISSSTYYYITLTRSSATDFEVKIRAASHSGTVLGTLTQSSIPSGTTGLRYLTASNYLQGQGQTLDISEVEFYNGVTTTVMPNAWKEEGT